MYTDAQLELSNAQAVTSSAASTNVIDTTVAGVGIPGLRCISQVDTAFAGGTSIAVTLQTATDEAFSSPIVLATGPAIALADLAAGKKLLDINIPLQRMLRYIRAYYTVVGTHTAGKVNTHLVFDTPQNDA